MVSWLRTDLEETTPYFLGALTPNWHDWICPSRFEVRRWSHDIQSLLNCQLQILNGMVLISSLVKSRSPTCKKPVGGKQCLTDSNSDRPILIYGLFLVPLQKAKMQTVCKGRLWTRAKEIWQIKTLPRLSSYVCRAFGQLIFKAGLENWASSNDISTSV